MIGSNWTVIPIFCNTWNKMSEAYPIMNNLLKGNSILVAKRTRWNIKAKKINIRITEPIKPNSSPITEKIKSV